MRQARRALNIRLLALLVGASFVFPGASIAADVDPAETRALADRFIEQHIELWDAAANESALRLQISGDAIVDAMLIWNSSGRLSFPTTGGVTHVFEDALLKERARLEALRSSGFQRLWEPVARGGERYFWCTDDRCLLVNGPALMDALGLAQRRHVELIAGQATRPPGLASAGVATALAIAGALLAFVWMRPRGRRQKGSGSTGETPRSFQFAHAEIDAAKLVIRDAQGERDLSRRELAILDLFASRPEAVITKDELYDAGWGRSYQPNSRALDQQILNLRKKLDPERCHEGVIETVHGQGYRFNP